MLDGDREFILKLLSALRGVYRHRRAKLWFVLIW